jgi:hypothetical protein
MIFMALLGFVAGVGAGFFLAYHVHDVKLLRKMRDEYEGQKPKK